MKKSFKVVIIVAFLALLAGLITTLFLLFRSEGPSSSGQSDKLIAEVAKIALLPQDEVPTVATVADLDALSGQPFFANAKVGDKVLIYNYAKKAFLYRPSSKRLIEMTTFSLEAGESVGETSGQVREEENSSVETIQ